MEQTYPKRPNILDEYSWSSAKKRILEDEDGDLWWQIRSHIVSVESSYFSAENFLRAMLQQITREDKFQSSFSKEYLSERHPLILDSEDDWEEIRDKLNACVWFELLQYSKTIEVLFENIDRITKTVLSEFYEYEEKGNTNGNDTEKL